MMINTVAAATSFILLNMALTVTADAGLAIPPPVSGQNTTPPKNGTNSTLPPVTPAPATNASQPPEPKIIPMACTQAFLLLPDDTAGPGPSTPSPANITEAGCKAFETPEGAYCQAESCSGLPTCSNCNLLIPDPKSNDTIVSNTTVASVQCASDYFLPDHNDTNRQSLCTDAQDQSYSCTGTCTGFATCQFCIMMNDSALNDPSVQASPATNSSK
ncbi:secreted protein [Melampsora americana]|nr:secreted protein [Melampsora americana]